MVARVGLLGGVIVEVDNMAIVLESETGSPAGRLVWALPLIAAGCCLPIILTPTIEGSILVCLDMAGGDAVTGLRRMPGSITPIGWRPFVIIIVEEPI